MEPKTLTGPDGLEIRRMTETLKIHFAVGMSGPTEQDLNILGDVMLNCLW